MKTAMFMYSEHKPVHKGLYKIVAYSDEQTIASYWNGNNFVGHFGPWNECWYDKEAEKQSSMGLFNSIIIQPVHTWTGIVRSK